MSIVGIGNIALRGITLVSKFIFVFFLGKYSVDETNLGVYGIFITTIAFLIYLLGFDFYVFNTREIIHDKKSLVPKVRDQFYFHLALYVLVIPIATFLVFGFEFIMLKYLLVFIALTVSEHLGQELFRLFTTLEKSLIANALFFVKSGLWIWYVLFDYFVLDHPIDLYNYFLFWLISSWGSMFIGLIVLKTQMKVSSWRIQKPDVPWILRGLKTSGIFFMGSLSFLVIQFSDRFMIDFFHGKKLVGVYTTYAQFINAIDVFTFSGIVMIVYPRLIKNVENHEIYGKLKKDFLYKLFIACVILILGSYLIAPYVFRFLEKPSFLEFISTYNILLIGVLFLVMSYVFHYDLYAKKRDTLLLRIAVTGMILNIVLNLILIPKYEIFGASLATLASFLIIFFSKLYFSTQKTKSLHDSI